MLLLKNNPSTQVSKCDHFLGFLMIPLRMHFFTFRLLLLCYTIVNVTVLVDNNMPTAHLYRISKTQCVVNISTI